MGLIATDKRTLVVGLGKTGLSCVRYLSGQGLPVEVADNREQPPCLPEVRDEFPDVPRHLGPFSAELFKRFDQLLVSPGLSILDPNIRAAREAGVQVSGDIDLFSRAAQAPLVAITGSNGKSTVTELVGQMARDAGVRVAVGGNLGTPALDLLDDDVELYVLELSSFQLETTESLNARVATVLNLSDDHMDRYADREAYYKAKQRVYRGCRVAVANLDDPLSPPLLRSGMTLRQFGFDQVNPGVVSTRHDEGRLWITRGLKNLVAADELRVRGRHNLANIMAALALGDAVELPMDSMLETVRRFPGLPHRCEFVRALAGVTYINDSKGTNVGATVAAIGSLSPAGGRILLIAGGDAKGADLTPLRAPVAESCRAVVLLGKDREQLASVLDGCCPIHRVRGLEEAVTLAAGLARRGDLVLLSPACSSLDMFASYEARGQAFRTQVEAL